MINADDDVVYFGEKLRYRFLSLNIPTNGISRLWVLGGKEIILKNVILCTEQIVILDLIFNNVHATWGFFYAHIDYRVLLQLGD